MKLRSIFLFVVLGAGGCSAAAGDYRVSPCHPANPEAKEGMYSSGRDVLREGEPAASADSQARGSDMPAGHMHPGKHHMGMKHMHHKAAEESQ